MRDILSKARSAKDLASKTEILYSMLSKFGPRLDPQRNGSIGSMSKAITIRAMTEHDVIVLYDGVAYIVWLESTAGLSDGVELAPTSVYVAGAKTIEIPGQGPRAVTLLLGVTDDELRSTMFGEKEAEPDKVADPDKKVPVPDKKVVKETYRVWRDKTGKFEVEALLVEVTKTHVVLTRKDTKTNISVPIKALSGDDVKFLGDRLPK